LKRQGLGSQIAQDNSCGNLIEVLRRHAKDHPSKHAIVFLRDGEQQGAPLTYAELDRRARAIAVFLRKEGASAGQRTQLLLSSGPEFISAFLGCLYAGVIAVPSFPFHLGSLRRSESWFRSVAADARPAMAFATPEMVARLANDKSDPLISDIRWFVPESIDLSLADEWREPWAVKDTIAFLQYTSGSTSSPKGVMISHGNLLHNMSVIQAACGTNQDSTIVTWLPLHHDMGLIGTVLQPLYLGARCVLMSPTAFLQKPLRWLQAISRYHADSSSAPNFAYDLCARKISQPEKEGLDLSAWRVAVNGAEPVRPETIERFTAAFSKCGFRAEAFYPSYGLAESTLMVASGSFSASRGFMRLSAGALEHNIVREASGDDVVRRLAACGVALPGYQLRVVDPESLAPCASGIVGEIWINGPSVAQGYWNRQDETAATFRARLSSGDETLYLRTGDLGFFAHEQLFITGRLKDLIILNGRNLYPHDIETTVQQCHASLRAASGAAFSIEVDNQEVLVAVQEVDRHSAIAPEKLISIIREAVLLEYGIQIYSVMLVKPGSVFKTTSGKIKRAACRTAFLAGKMQAVASSTLAPRSTETAFASRPLTKLDLLQSDPDLRLELVESYWRESVARIAKADLHDIDPCRPLISIGLDSLGATELAHQVEMEMALSISVTSLLDGLSLRQLAAMILDQLGLEEQARTLPERRNKGEAWPLSHGQKGLWILHKIAPASVAYTLASAVRIKEKLDFPALERAFLQILERHEMLRTVFSQAGGEPVQMVQSLEHISLSKHIQRISFAEPEDRLRSRMLAEVQIPFLLEEAPPIRFFVFELPSGDHVLLLVLHHMIADLWSIGILLQELSAAYLGQCAGHPAAFPELCSSYRDFISWQSGKIHGDEGAALLNYWRTQLSGDLPVLQLPVDHPRPPIFSYRGASEGLRLEPFLYQKIQSIARAENVTPFMVLSGAFLVLLHRICGQEDVLLGSPANGRSKSEFAGVAGYFVNPIVLRSYYDASTSFRSYLGRLRRSALEAFSHQDYPFPLLVEHLHPKREAGVPPIFQAMFVWLELPGSEGDALAAMSAGNARAPLQFAGMPAEPVPLDNTGSQFDLTLLMSASGADLLGSMKYSTDLFDSGTIQRLAGHFSVMLTAITGDLQQPLAALPLMTLAERGELLRKCSMGLPSSLAGQGPILELFEAQVRANPSAPALIAGKRRMTFEQLNAQANQFARYLRTLGVQAESLVGICLERSAEMIAAIFGIWKAGGAYVPFETRDPRARLAAMMEHVSLQALITHELLLERLPEQLPPVVLLDLDLDVIAQESDSDLEIAIDPCSVAYVIHTSGSTGAPKGVMIEHRCLINLLAGLRETVYAGHDRRLTVGLNAPFTFDSSIKQLITLAMGHSLCLIPEDIRRDGPALLSYMREMGLDVLDCTPTQAQLFMEAGWDKSVGPAQLLLGGEAVPQELWKALARPALKPCYNLYGPTECTVDATACPVAASPEPLIGRPLSGTNIYILDEQLEPVPAGVPGEIFIGGQSVGRGYLHLSDLTAEKFLPDPLSAVAGARMYRTGDQACWLSNGGIRFIGRVDRQVKVRGFRIEPGEIESALRAQSGVRDAAVVAMNIGNGHKQLIGYVVSEEKLASNHYRQLLAKTLPDYMIPAMVISVAEIRVNAHGKKDYAALPLPQTVELECDDYSPPQSDLEQHLVNLWTKALRVQPIGIHDNFFSLGGDSLQATKLITQIQEEYPIGLPLLALFFQEPTIASLARFIETAKAVPRSIA
jgi:amino acid adenylation domain-containing protein